VPVPDDRFRRGKVGKIGRSCLFASDCPVLSESHKSGGRLQLSDVLLLVAMVSH
jgi:hypothetical protein